MKEMLNKSNITLLGSLTNEVKKHVLNLYVTYLLWVLCNKYLHKKSCVCC